MNDTDESKRVLQHLANERTVLAWLRSILSVSGVGFALITLAIDTHISRWYPIRIVAEGLTLSGALASVLATVHYFKKRAEINVHGHRSSLHSLFWLYGLLGLILVVAVGLGVMQFLSHV
ncbi:YidH family protein [Alicyclobacillus shizuokensis]|uniref:YidH family protein n=1 Tax=Alicyclobacillus shizuokensis TaxID=392014 RepID=UPI000833D683|nr:DUF202 domain-containing protein [Alicyclobacillus shizuokensis]MCL6626991.1 DUF202 domain-containing protein [Alicyclobacillus shizuokensis]